MSRPTDKDRRKQRSRNTNQRAKSANVTPRPAAERKEIKYYGVAACQALWRNRAHDVIRIYIDEPRVKEFGEMLRWAAGERKAYHIVTPEELEKITESVHHQGVCILAREPQPVTFGELFKDLQRSYDPQMVVYLDGVENPHNLGAIVRSCAHFGIRYVLGPSGRLPSMSPSAYRVAEGGAEKVSLVALSNPIQQLRELEEIAFDIYATSSKGGESLFAQHFPKRVVLAMGAEVEGISRDVLLLSETVIHIPGAGGVESLNVSAAFAVMAGEYYRQRHASQSQARSRRPAHQRSGATSPVSRKRR